MHELVTVATYDSLPAAELAKSLLVDEGIQAVLDDANLVATYSFLSLAVGGIKLRVLRADLARAEAVLSAIQLKRSVAADSVSVGVICFRCGACGAVLEFPGSRRGGVEVCKKCGGYVDVPSRSDASLIAAGGVTPEPAAAETSVTDTFVTDTSEKLESAPKRRIPLGVEILGVLALVYLPHMIHALLNFDYQSNGFETDMALLAIGAVQKVVPLLLIIALCGEGWKKFGIVPIRWGLDCLLAFVIVNACSMALILVYTPFATASSAPPPTEPYAWTWQTVAWCLMALSVNSLAEELAMRGYLITRLEELWRSRWVAVSASAFLFGSYHAYQGLWGAVGAGTIGLVYGGFYVWQRRLWPLVLAHTFYNATLYFESLPWGLLSSAFSAPPR